MSSREKSFARESGGESGGSTTLTLTVRTALTSNLPNCEPVDVSIPEALELCAYFLPLSPSLGGRMKKGGEGRRGEGRG
jgi:hypothetical protein